VFLFLPMAVLVTLSFNSARRGAKWEGFTLDWYSKLFSNEAILEPLLRSLEIAFLAAVLSAIFGVAVALTLVRGTGWSRAVLSRMASLPIVLPDIVQGLSLLCFFVLIGLPLGELSIIVAHTAFGTAYVATLVKARLAGIDPLIEEAAADLGADPLVILTKITLPQLWPAVVSGMLMVFTLSFDDFIIAFFTAGVGATTLPLKIYSMLKFGVSPEVNALSVLILLFSLTLVTLAFWNQNKKTAAAA
ncbi:MAG TPA: ABC transporter permease, partial [Bdellovibrionales bacterium]|nr:ABC transporter permease [Bdellovibrionales bacterium]